MKLIQPIKNFVKKLTNLAGFYRYLRDSKALNGKVKYRKNIGFFFNGNSLMENGDFEPQETIIIDSAISSGSFDMFVNIGANTGYYVCKALKKGIPTIAFEPNQLNVNILLNNIKANNFDADFHFFPIALSNQNNILPMYGSSTGASLIYGWANQKNTYLIPVNKFDNVAGTLIYKKSCLVVIDIEGAELNCIKGAELLLKASKNNLFLIEITTSEHQPNGIKINPNLVDTFLLMFDYGYKAFAATKKIREINISEVKKVAKTGINTLETHNFIFVKNKNILNNIIFN